MKRGKYWQHFISISIRCITHIDDFFVFLKWNKCRIFLLKCRAERGNGCSWKTICWWESAENYWVEKQGNGFGSHVMFNTVIMLTMTQIHSVLYFAVVCRSVLVMIIILLSSIRRVLIPPHLISLPGQG